MYDLVGFNKSFSDIKLYGYWFNDDTAIVLERNYVPWINILVFGNDNWGFYSDILKEHIRATPIGNMYRRMIEYP